MENYFILLVLSLTKFMVYHARIPVRPNPSTDYHETWFKYPITIGN